MTTGTAPGHKTNKHRKKGNKHNKKGRSNSEDSSAPASPQPYPQGATAFSSADSSPASSTEGSSPPGAMPPPRPQGGSTRPGSNPTANSNGKHGDKKSPGAHAPFQFDAATWAASKPSLHLHQSIEGLFQEENHPIGGSYTEAALEHWQHLGKDEKRALMTDVSNEDVYDALRELHLTGTVEVQGEVREETVEEVAKAFLHALEVNDGNFKFPTAPSLEFIGVFVALETNLLLDMETKNMQQHVLMVWGLIMWRQSRVVFAVLLVLTLLLVGMDTKWCVQARNLLWGTLTETFVLGRRWHTYVHWKVETVMISVLSIVMASRGGMRWYVLTLACVGTALVLDYLSASPTRGGSDRQGLVTLRSVLLHLQKFVLVLLSYPSWVALLTVGFYYFPAVLILGFSSIYFLVGLGLSLSWRLFRTKILGKYPRHRDCFDEWWTEGRDGLNRAVVVAVLAVCLLPYTFWRTWNLTPNWQGTFCRVVSVNLVANIVSLEDLQRAGEAFKEVGHSAVYRVRKLFSRRGSASAQKPKDD